MWIRREICRFNIRLTQKQAISKTISKKDTPFRDVLFVVYRENIPSSSAIISFV